MLTGLGVRLHRAGLVLGGRQVLGPLELDVGPGSRIVLLGANGAGKTQLLKLLAGERWPTPTAQGDEERAYRDGAGGAMDVPDALRRIALIGGERQDKYYRYDWNFSVQRVVATGVHQVDRPIVRLNPAERARVRGLMRRFRLEPLARRRFLTLSYGERRRVLLARAFAGQPALLLLDEVHNGLDQATRAILDRELARRSRSGATIVLAAHRRDDVPAGFERGLVLAAGQVTFDGPLSAAPQDWLALEGAAAAPVVTSRRQAKTPLFTVRDGSVYRDYRPVVERLHWTIEAGEHWAITGANGSGKSTLLQAVYGLLPFAASSVVARRGYEAGSHIQSWRRRIGFVSPELQTEYLDVLNVEDFVVSGERLTFGLAEKATAAERRRARAALRLAGFGASPKAAIHTLSYGQRRLALLARALVLQPEALLLDEPLTGLDAPYRAQVRALLSALAQSGLQIIMVAHHADDLIPQIGKILDLRRSAARIQQRAVIANAVG